LEFRRVLFRSLEAADRQGSSEGAGDALDVNAQALEPIELRDGERYAERRIDQHEQRGDRNQRRQSEDDETPPAHQNCVEMNRCRRGLRPDSESACARSMPKLATAMR